MEKKSINNYLIAGSIVIIVLVLVVAGELTQSKSCNDSPSEKVSILMDRSEPYMSALQAEEVELRVRRVLDNAQDNALITVFFMTKNGFDPSKELSVCKPATKINPLFGDPQEAFKKFKRSVIQKAIETINQPIAVAPESPIAETLSTLIATDPLITTDSAGNLIPVKLHIFSDLVQNSKSASLYDCPPFPNMEKLNNLGIPEKLNRFSSVAKIHIHQIRRDKTVKNQPSSTCIRKFWSFISNPDWEDL